jgi:hypothetical protein
MRSFLGLDHRILSTCAPEFISFPLLPTNSAKRKKMTNHTVPKSPARLSPPKSIDKLVVYTIPRSKMIADKWDVI